MDQGHFVAESQEAGINLCFSQLQKDPRIPDFHHGNLIFSVKDLERGLPNAAAVFSSLMLKHVMTGQAFCGYVLLPGIFSFNLVTKNSVQHCYRFLNTSFTYMPIFLNNGLRGTRKILKPSGHIILPLR